MYVSDAMLKRLFAIAITVFGLLLCVSFVHYNRALSRALDKAAVSTLENFSTASTAVISQRLTQTLASVKGLSGLISSEENLFSPELMKNLSVGAKNMIYDHLVVVRRNGEGLSTAGDRLNVGHREYFKKAMKGESSISLIHKSIISGGEVIIFAVPIYHAEKVIGVLYASLYQEKFKSIFYTAPFNKSGFSCVVAKNGEIISAPHDKKQADWGKIKNVFDFDRTKLHRLASDAPLFPDKTIHGHGSMLYVENDKQSYLYYTPIPNTEWFLISVIPLAALIAQNQDFIDITLLFGMTIFIIFALLCFVLWILVSEQMRRARVANERLDKMTSNIPGGVSCCLANENIEITEISDGYLALLECTRAEFSTFYKNCFINTVYAADRERVMLALQDTEGMLKNGGMIALEYRIVTPKGNTRWVTDRGRLGTDKEGRTVFYCVVLDNSAARASAEALSLSEERYRIVTEIADEYLFDWNIISDEAYFSNAYNRRFGGKRFFEIIISEDIPKYKRWIKHLSTCNAEQRSTEVRMHDASGTLIWASLQAAFVKDNSGQLCRLVGCLRDITKQVEERDRLVEEAQTDSLTRLYSKGTTNRLITEALAKAGKNSYGAVFVCDIDNFKTINDTLGHLAGDSLLTECAERLRGIFRSTDIVGRIGGDEFMVMMRNAANEEAVVAKARETVKAFRMSYGPLSVTASIGIAVYTQDGDTLEELYKAADTALYCAKQKGKNGWVMYGDCREEGSQKLTTQ